MKKHMTFFSIFLATIVISRVFLWIRPTSSPTVYGFRMHHYMYGIVLVVLGLAVRNKTVYAIGLGLLLDEVPLLMMGGSTYQEYFSAPSLVGVGALIGAVFFSKERIMPKVMK